MLSLLIKNVGWTDGVTVNYSMYDSFIVIVSYLLSKLCLAKLCLAKFYVFLRKEIQSQRHY